MKEMVSSGMNRRVFLKNVVIGSALVTGALAGFPILARAAAPYTLPPLPYPEDALEPHVSGRTISFHYGKHHRGYVEKTNELVKGTGMEGLTLDELMKESARRKNQSLFNNAAQVWNHTFYWRGMKPKGGGSPSGGLEKTLARSFGSVEEFKQRFSEAAEKQFGSGYAWLVQEGEALKVMGTANADNPLVHGMRPLLTMDVWEHAYYLDYQNRRKDHIRAFIDHLINWDFVSQNWSAA